MLYPVFLKINFSLMQLVCQISKKLYSESTPCNNLEYSAQPPKQANTDIRHVVESTKV